MPTFLGLPVEIQLLIISNIPLNEIENFALCSKVVHQLSRKRLMEQYARKRYFSTIAVGHTDNMTWDEDQRIRGVHPLLILRDLLADAQSWLYTKTLIIGYLDEFSGGFEDPEEAQLDEVEFQDAVAQFKLNTRLLKIVVEVQRRLYPERAENDLEKCPKAKKWTQAILNGETEPAASLLVAILPNIQKIRLVDEWKDPRYDSFFLKTLNDLLEAALSDKHDLIGINSFNKVIEVGMCGLEGMYGLDEQYGANYEIFNWFMALPSMRTIKGRVIDGRSVNSFSQCSKVESLTFHRSAIHASVIEDTLGALRGLQSFTYDFWAGAPLEDEKWEPRQIVEALAYHTETSLRHLELTSLLEHERGGAGNFQSIDFWRGEPFIGSLCAFEVLEKIRLETRMLYKETEGANRRT